MNKTFDIKRLGMVIRWDFLALWKYYLGSIIGCVIAFSFYSLVRLHQYEGVTMAEGVENHYITQESTFFGCMIFCAFYVMASCIFTNMRTKNYRESFLMLPACNQEKYLARMLIMGIGSFVELVLILLATDVIQLAFSYILHPGFHLSITLPVLSRILGDLIFTHFRETELMILSFLIFAHSFCTLGGTFYRKMAPLLTLVTALVLFIVLGYILYELAKAGLLDFSIDEGYLKITVTTIFFLALSAFNYWASYKIFCRMQVISNKWINI